MATWKIAVAGLEGCDRALIETAIDLASGLEIGRWQLVGEPEMAQVIIANIDSLAGEEILEKFDPEENSAIVVKYSTSEDIDNVSENTLSPPLSYKNITSLLKNLESDLIKTRRQKPKLEEKTRIEKPQTTPKTSSMAAMGQINPADIIKHKIDWLADEDPDDVLYEEDECPLLTDVASPLEDINDIENIDDTVFTFSTETFVPESRLLGLILNIIEGGKTTRIHHQDYPELRLFPDNGWFIFTEELDSYPDMFREPADSFSIDVLEEEIKDELISGRLPQSLWKLLYTAALFGSEGRLLDHLQHEKPFYLRHTPYFGMIPHTADHIAIAEYMVNYCSDIESISNDTRIDFETVIDFCNACDAIQLLKNSDVSDSESISDELTNIAELENDATVESEIIRDSEQQKPGLIHSLWSNLTRSS